MCTAVYSNIIYDSTKVDAATMLCKWRGGEQNGVSIRQDTYHAAQKNSELGKFFVK